MFGKSAGFEKPENKYSAGEQVILYSRRFKNVYATIKEVFEADKLCIVTTADGKDETMRVDFDEIKKESPGFELKDLTMNSVEDGKDGDYRPIGRGNGKERDAQQIVGQAFLKLEKELGKGRVPVVAIKYEKTDVEKWHNGLNALWIGKISFAVDMLDDNGSKHTATASVPVEGGQLKDVEYFNDNMNRKFSFNKEGFNSFMSSGNPNYNTQDESVYENPGTYPALAKGKMTFVKKASFVPDRVIDLLYKKAGDEKIPVEQKLAHEWEMFDDAVKLLSHKTGKDGSWAESQLGSFVYNTSLYNSAQEIVDAYLKVYPVEKIDSIAQLKTAHNILYHARQIMDEEDFEQFQKLYRLKKMIQDEINNQEQFNEARGGEKDLDIKYERLDQINEAIDGVFGKYQNSINNYFSPVEAKNNMIDRIVKNIKGAEKKLSPGEEGEQALKKENEDYYNKEHKKPMMERYRDKQESESESESNTKKASEYPDTEQDYDKYISEQNEMNINLKIKKEYEDRKKDVEFVNEFGWDAYKKKYPERYASMKKAEMPDEEMNNEKEEDEKIPGEKKKTMHKPIDKKVVDEYQRNDSPAPAGKGTREFSDMSPKDPADVKFQS